MNSLTKIHKVYFRLDCGGLIGFGHLSRCMSLGEELLKENIEPVFIIRKRPSIAHLRIPFKTIWLEEIPDTTVMNPEKWIHHSISEELNELAFLEPRSIIVLDHYGLNRQWQSYLRDAGRKVVLFQDTFSSDYEADILINCNVSAIQYSDKYSHTNSDTVYLLGPRFAPLNSAYLNEHKMRFSIEKKIEVVGIYLGGVGLTALKRVAEAFRDNSFFDNKKIEWVVSSDEEQKILQAILYGYKLKTHVRLPSLLPVYQSSDLFVGACGVAFLERACMGLWQLNFWVADNQSEIAETIEKEELGFVIGDIRKLDSKEINQELNKFLKLKKETIFQSIERVFKQVDGLGANNFLKKCLEVLG